VVPAHAATPDFGDPHALLQRELERDAASRDRFAGARLVRPPIVLGPLAIDATGEPIDGLLVAGDASGFVDPMTGDGLRFAVRGGELAALSALEALEHGWHGVHARLTAARHREFAGKWRFNRALRALVASPAAIGAATRAAVFAPVVVRAIVQKAGDCDVA
jgi:flavin-dependent dehydrogenase